MKAVVYSEYGAPEVLRLTDVAKPIPKDNEILIKVHTTSVTTADVNARGSTFVPKGFGFMQRLMFGLNKPKVAILGTELAGHVVAVGNSTTRYKAGDRIVAYAATGGYAEYACLPEDGVISTLPDCVTYEQAVVVPVGGATALHFLRDLGQIENGQRVLVNGASGAVGTYAVQLAKHFRAHVTGVCSTRNVDLVHSLGADEVVDYTQKNFIDNGRTYDIILDTTAKVSYKEIKQSLTATGRFLAVAGGLREFVQMGYTALYGGRKVIAGAAPDKQESLVYLINLVAEGHLNPVIDRNYPLQQIVEAHRYVDTGRKRGNVVISVLSLDGQPVRLS